MVEKKKPGEGGVEAPEIAPTYPAVEKLIATEDFSRIDRNLTQAYEALEKIRREGGMGRSKDARKAMKAIDKVLDLFKELVNLKRQATK